MSTNRAKGIVQRLMGRRPTVDETPLTGDAGLSLMHLRKLFMEFIHSSVPLTLKEQEKKLYAMLPVFNKVFCSAEGTEMTERFGDVLQFAAHTSRLMVNEIRRHAVNKSNDNASTAIMNFLVKKPDGQTQSGWNLLQSLSILANGESAIVADMIATQLPSTLVHCVYLFFDLPQPAASSSTDSNVLEESYLTVQKLFIQLLVRLCNQSITAQELVRTDDLFILFTAMTCKCKPHNIGWRTGICEVLTSITKHGLRSDVCDYIHAKSCISRCVSSMLQIQTETPLELVEMFITLFTMLKDSTAISSVLFDDFRSCYGYLILQEYLLQLGELEDDVAADACRNMVICVSNFTMAGYISLRPSRSIGAPFQDSDFQMPTATENGNTVRNIEAFHVLQSVFVKSKNSLLCQHILDSILRIYTSDHVNYFILEPQRTISTFIEKVNDKEPTIQEKVFKLLEFVACNLNWTPSPELISLSILFKNTRVHSSWIFALECLIQLVNYKDQYKNVFRDVGLLEVLTKCLVYYTVALKKMNNNKEDDNSPTKKEAKGPVDPELVPDEDTLAKYVDYPMLLMECVRIMLEKCSENAVMFRKCGGAECVHSLVEYESSRGEALKIIQELILNGGRDDLGTLLRRMHTCKGSVVSMKIDLLRTVIRVFALEPATRAMFREAGGFVYVMSVLMSMEGALSNEPSSKWRSVERSDILELFRVVFYVLTSAMQDEPANKTFFMDEVRYKGLADSLRLLGCFDTNSSTLSTEWVVSPACMRRRLRRTRSSRSSIYVDPQVPKFHPQSSLFAALHVLHCLLDMAMDSFTLKLDTSCNDEQDTGRVYPLDVSCICHPGAVTVLVELLPSIGASEEDLMLHHDGDYQDALDLQLYVANKVQSCLRSERNQQVMCQAGLPQQILLHCQAALELEEHPLHLPLQRIFERLATQALTPVVLRDFMRLGHPLQCAQVEIQNVKTRENNLKEDKVDGSGLVSHNTLNHMRTSSDAIPDVHKRSLQADFNETLLLSGNCFLDRRSRTSSANSSLSGGEEEYELIDVDIENKSRRKKRIKAHSKSKSKFYAPSPGSSFDGIDDAGPPEDIFGSSLGNMTLLGSPVGNFSESHADEDSIIVIDDVHSRSPMDNVVPLGAHRDNTAGSHKATSVHSMNCGSHYTDVLSDPIDSQGQSESRINEDTPMINKDTGGVNVDNSAEENGMHELPQSNIKGDKELETKRPDFDSNGNERRVRTTGSNIVSEGYYAYSPENTAEQPGRNDENVLLTVTNQQTIPDVKSNSETTSRENTEPGLLSDNHDSGEVFITPSTDDNHADLITSSHVTRRPSNQEGNLVTPNSSATEIATRQGGGPVSLSRIKCLVSMTTPRDMHLCGTTSLPGFVEFNMSLDGFGCLFFSSIAPQIPTDTALVGSMAGVSSAMIGAVQGIGTSDRNFPPQAGVTYVAWFCVERFSSPYQDPHPIRLLNICSRTKQINGTYREDTCLNIRISGNDLDRSLVVTTEEELTGHTPPSKKPKSRNEARFPLRDRIQEGCWHHIVVTLNKALISKHSTATVYLDGVLVGTEKLRYIQNTLPSNASFTVSTVDAYIGTRRSLRRCSKLIWQLGPCHFLEEPIQAAEAALMYQLGPSYLGSFQAPFINKNNHSGERDIREPLVAEANIVFGLHAHATSLITFAKLRKHFSKSESRAVAHKLGLSKKDNSTPVRLMHNTASHLQGPSRCLGGVIVGISGVRTFFPRPVAELVSCVGGTTALLGLVAMANDVEMLYAAVKALSCVLKHSFSARQDMERIKGYQILALLFKRKNQLLNTHILHLTFALVGTVDSEREMSVIPNEIAFKDLLCDFEVWTRTPENLQKSLVTHILELLGQPSQLLPNVNLMQELGVVAKMLFVLKDETTPISTIKVTCEVLSVLLNHGMDKGNILRFGQFLAWTISPTGQDETILDMNLLENLLTSSDRIFESNEQRLGKKIILRNLLLEIFLTLVGAGRRDGVTERFSLLIQELLGFDWIMLFMKENIHKSTVVRALRLLVTILSESIALSRFREVSCNGGWLKGTEALSSKSVHVVGGFNVKPSTSSDENCEVNEKAVNVPGFVSLNQLLSKHVAVPEIYHLVISLLLRHPVADVDAGKQFDWDSLYHVFWVSCTSISNTSPPPSPLGPGKHSIYCAEAACVLLSMARMVCGMEWQYSPQDSWLLEYPVTVVQFLTFLYHNVEQFSMISSSQDFIEHLVAVAFPEAKQIRIVSNDVSALDILSSSRGTVVMCNDDKESLIRHPAKRLIMGFIRVLITDALTTPPFLKAGSLVDMILESFPASSKLHQVQEFQTEVLHSQMEYLLAGNLLANPGKVMASICCFTARVVDKLWQDHFNLGYKPIFNFIRSIIESCKGNWAAKDGVFHSLNRVILYQLSRQLKESNDFDEMIEFLHMLTAHAKIVFSPVNNNGEFIACLCYHLLIVTEASLPEHNHVDGIAASTEIIGPQDLSHTSSLLSAAAERVWEVFIHSKKEVIESVFKIEFPKSTFTKYGIRDISISNNSFKTKNLDPKSLGPMLLEPAKAIWDRFSKSQQQQLRMESPKVQKSVRINLRKPTEKKKEKIVDLPSTDIHAWTDHNIDLAKKLFVHQHRNFLQNYRLIERSIAQDWSLREDDLTRVRGLWGPPSDSRLDKWMLDMVEGPYRMRKKMCQNDNFYEHYSYRTQVKTEKPCKFKIPMSFDSRLYAMLSNQKISALEMKSENKYERSISEFQSFGIPEFKEVEVNEYNDMEDQTILKLLEAGEKIRSMFRCARVEGLDHAEGLFLFGQSHFYVVDGVTMLSTKEIKDIDSIPPDAHDPIIPRSSHDTGKSTFQKICSTWAYEAVREVQKRRYLLQDTALEVFSSDGRNHLLVFPKSVRDKVYNKMLSMIPANPIDYVSGQKPDTEVETSLGIITSIIGEKSVTQRWERGEISNFQYLMYLNTLSGRSYNDLMQYPVFPWIIADYDSEELDLNNPATFRDLSKPMGTQTDGRKKDFEKRYREWDDPTGETPAYHYATHYSSAMVVASYLVRMEPFAQHFLRLQDGHFDLPDRMFHGVKDAWLSASETNMADVKELIPEFFYLPEFLLNHNRFDLGQKQSGVVLGDVVLPRWAKGDTREFIRLHRKALECDYVSSKLHLWIDLIFGYKQRGDAARDAVNVFHHWFYADSADITNITDPVKRNAKIGFINNFGQTPRQLFKKPHVSKKAFFVQDQEQSGASFVVNADRLFSNFTKMMPSTQPVKEIKGPVGEIVQSDKGILAVKKNHTMFPPPCNQYVAWGYGDLSLRIGQLDGDKIIAVMEDFQVGQILCAACPDSRTLITGGKNTLVYVWVVDRENKDKRPQLAIHEILYGHLQPVTCLAVSSSYNLIVSGSEDMTCIIWDLNKLTYVRQLRGHVSAISTISINNLTGDIVTCAGTYLYLWSVNGQLVVEENTSLRPSNPIHCCLMSEVSEWDEDVILTGDQDGVVKMWGVEFFDENAKPYKSRDENIDEGRDVLHNESASEETEIEKKGLTVPRPVELTVPVIRPTSVSRSEDYIMIHDAERQFGLNEKLSEEAVWRRRLVMRSQLTMHTAFDREDNNMPAAVTAMLISKDHKKLYVGDARGRVHSWSVSDTAGRIADHWVKDESSDNCTACHVKFTLRERKHHCRNCGRLFCSKCSDFQSRIPPLGIRTPVRVCFSCYTKLNTPAKSKR